MSGAHIDLVADIRTVPRSRANPFSSSQAQECHDSAWQGSWRKQPGKKVQLEDGEAIPFDMLVWRLELGTPISVTMNGSLMRSV
jgi:hypothetical protein